MSASGPLQSGTAIASALLRDALQALPDAIAVFDADDRLVFWNDNFAEFYSRSASLAIGDRFEDLIRASVAKGLVADALGREEEWIADRLRRHNQPDHTREHRLANGRWIRTQERRSKEGWFIGIRSDITDLKEQEASFRLLFESNPTPLYVVHRETLAFKAVNDAALTLYGHSRERFLAMTMLDTRPKRDHAEFLRLAQQGSMFDYPGLRSWTHLREDGREISVVPYTKPLTIDGQPMCLVSIVDLTDRQRAEDEVRKTKAFLRSVVESIPVGVFVKDMHNEGRYVIYNRACEALVGRNREEIIGRTDREVFSPSEADRFAAQDAEVIRRDDLLVLPAETVTRGDGDVRTFLTRKLPITGVGDDPARYIVGISEDITEQQLMASRLEHQAYHDTLTGLPNRLLLRRRLEAMLRGPGCMALHYIDLDGFKLVNDTLGHRVGDGLLKAAASRLGGVLSASDMAARLGGDEFVVLQDSVSDPLAFTGLAHRLVEVLSAPYDVDGQHIVVGASIGVALSAEGSSDPDQLLLDADTALYAAKAGPRGSFRIFDPQMNVEARARRELANEVMHALERQQFVLFYQPFVNVKSGTLAGFEALIRWQHPVRGLIPPGDFIPVAEDLGMIGAIGKWVVGQACRDAASWPVSCRVAVNLSPCQFEERDLVESVEAAIAQTGLDPTRLELEITETVLLEESEKNLQILRGLQRLGVTIALDDFGTGYSSLSLLQRFTVDKIKIDRSFTRGLPIDRGSLAVLRAVVALAGSLDIQTTAEGVETEAQFSCIKAEGCDAVQGWLLGRPMPADEVHGLLGAAAAHAA